MQITNIKAIIEVKIDEFIFKKEKDIVTYYVAIKENGTVFLPRISPIMRVVPYDYN